MKEVFLGILAILLLIVLSLGARWLIMPVDKMVERKVLVESHQYKEGMAERVAILQASLAEINVKLSSNLTESVRNGLRAQKASINVQLQAARR